MVTVVWSVALYGSEAWTRQKEDTTTTAGNRNTDDYDESIVDRA